MVLMKEILNILLIIVICSNAFRIDVKRKNHVELNGTKINANSIHDHLEEHEVLFLFGNSNSKPDLHFAHVNRKDISTTLSKSRGKRSLSTPQKVSIKVEGDNGEEVDLKLQQVTNLIDDAFILIRRYENSSQFITNSHKMAMDYEKCFYRDENSSLDLCDDTSVRGVFHYNSKDFLIHPLPERFGRHSHVIFEATPIKNNNNTRKSSILQNERLFNEDKNSMINLEHFEPEIDSFNEINTATNIKIATDLLNENPQKNNKYSENILWSTEKSMIHEIYAKKHNYNHNNNINKTINYKNFNKENNRNYNNYDEFKKNNNHNNFSTYDHQDQNFLRFKSDKNYNYNNHINSTYNRTILDYDTSTTLNKDNDQHWWKRYRVRRHIDSASSSVGTGINTGNSWKAPQVLHIETAIFVDRDLFKHMARNFPKNTESHLIRFVLAMINGVQLLYHHPSLGHQINFVLKRLEILHSDPKELRRSSDIDIYLNNFCMWQRKLNPTSDSDVVHYDHAVILTGLDLYVVGKNNKISSQVVGLAPVSGMCTSTSSCTINEGKHFESVFVVAHEIGHNLGMRHDTSENNCDPSLYIMSPTLGSGKITWSKCSRNYLQAFLEAPQAKCLFDRGQFGHSLDHSAEGILPGERFDADQQCMLKYGKDSIRARRQLLTDICRDLHCQRDRYTWTSHPALEGTECGELMWCRSGICIAKNDATVIGPYPNPKVNYASRKHVDKVSFLENKKMASLRQYNFDKPAIWSEWSHPTECASGCLYGPSGRLREGSTGLRIFTRTCLDYKRRCSGQNRKYETCVAKQCYTIDKTTIQEFATQICERATKFDNDIIGHGLQILGDNAEDSCKVFCKTKINSTKSRSWTFPDGTTCQNKKFAPSDIGYCINGRCERFSCDNSTNNLYKVEPKFCPQNTLLKADDIKSSNNNEIYNKINSNNIYKDNERDYKSIMMKVNENYKHFNNNNNDNKINNSNYNTNQKSNTEDNLSREILRNSNSNYKANSYNYENKYRNPHETSSALSKNNINKKSDTSTSYSRWKYESDQPVQEPPARIRLQIMENEWMVKSGCHFSCMDRAKGVQVVQSKTNHTNNIQLCSPRIKPCDKLQTTTEFAKNICSRYKLKVRGLSGFGMQIAPSEKDPDRSCKVACQDERLRHRFYLVNGEYGLFPFGTKCSGNGERYCISGKCLEFGPNLIPLTESYMNLSLFRRRRKRDLTNIAKLDDTNKELAKLRREKRNYIYFMPIIIRENVTQQFIDKIIDNLSFEVKNLIDESISNDHIKFDDPIHISIDELTKD
ncbi:uncharacterized protein LOC129611040 [Condylostylus longicornis]|uniref:uncharacterized protein LOC129611040 n=1 Tax=Condylostylus longicornis TaxID=2530218 RepID=UPI00244DCE0E|nr:uncharacterized protein LOC129611040 [Condylostylus longicornis]XP_055379929.1 uncharacterized protein LOC129611040 [Condylostylus longicornis]XP_055379930.1 uncharacterized protein LOC129611040 [Condylostylus longicornis]XP_055379931.1 uncharacterized protein LOC129611040 [Condylostylus longicornis]